jgi:hypothetical protein
MPKFSVRISWHVVFEIPTSSATSQTLKQQLEWITCRTFWMFPTFFDVEVRPECSLSSTEVCPSLHLYHSGICVQLMPLSTNAHFNILKVSENCSRKSPIHNCWKICQASKTHVHSNRNSTMTKQTRTIQLVAFTWGNSLLNSTISGTLLHLHIGAPIQNFGKCTDPLPMFCS